MRSPPSPRNGNPLTLSESLAAEERQGEIDDLPERLGRYATAHKRALEMSHYVQHQGDTQLSYKLAECGSYLLFRYYLKHEQVRLHAAQFCKKHLLCPLCAIRRGVKAMQAYEKKILHVLESNPGLRASMVTVTLKNGSVLHERFRHLKNSVRRWISCRRKDGYEDWEILKMLGGVWSYEVKRGNGSGEWHPHAHMIWLHYADLDSDQLSAEWKWATGDSFIVDARPIRPDENGSLIGGMLEVFKYAVKFSDMPLEDNWHAFEELSGERMISSAGLLWGVQIPEDLTDEELSGPYAELVYRFVQGRYSLQKHTKVLDPQAAPVGLVWDALHAA